MRIMQDINKFTADRAWGALDLMEIDGATVRLHLTDKPYHWHVNDGAEVFVVLSGEVDMFYKDKGTEKSVRLKPTDIFLADVGDEHVAHPVSEGRILVIERKGSA